MLNLKDEINRSQKNSDSWWTEGDPKQEPQNPKFNVLGKEKTTFKNGLKMEKSRPQT